MTWAKVLLLAAVAVSAFAQNGLASEEVDAVYPEAYASIWICIRIRNSLFMNRKRRRNWRAGSADSATRSLKMSAAPGLLPSSRTAAAQPLCSAPNSTHLPVEEKTGLPYASKVRAKDISASDLYKTTHQQPNPSQ